MLHMFYLFYFIVYFSQGQLLLSCIFQADHFRITIYVQTGEGVKIVREMIDGDCASSSKINSLYNVWRVLQTHLAVRLTLAHLVS